MSYRYEREAPRATGASFLLIAVPPVATVVVLILAFAYYSGSSARIAGIYTALAAPANQALTAEVDGYTHDQRHHLAAAKSDLAREVKTETSFDKQLAGVTFPAAANAVAAVLIRADKKRAKLVGLQARATSLRKMRSFDTRVQAANAAVATQAGLIREALGLPPASGQLY